ncbi:hypothetical protein ACPCXD_18240 [Rhodococcus sp. AB351]|uniref:hypothetical protein n=1 Tax=Rhodococcus sp. AB351 TaxID=3413280 RepID=UPI003C156DA6
MDVLVVAPKSQVVGIVPHLVTLLQNKTVMKRNDMKNAELAKQRTISGFVTTIAIETARFRP